MEAKGFVLPSNLKVPDVTSPLYSDNDELSDWYDSDLIESEDFEKPILLQMMVRGSKGDDVN